MSQAVRFLGIIPTPKEFDVAFKRDSLNVASDILSNGGPQDNLQEAFISLAGATGNKQKDIDAAVVGKQQTILPHVE